MHSISRALLRSFVAVFFLALIPDVSNAQTPGELKVYAMDIEKQVVHSISMPSGNIVESPKLADVPSMMVPTPDGSKLLVFERDKKNSGGSTRAEGGLTLAWKIPNAVSILDARDMKLVARVPDVGWDAVAYPAWYWPRAEMSAAWDSSGSRLTVLAWGQAKHDPEIVQLDVATATVKRRPLACVAGEVNAMVQLSADLAAVAYGKRDQKKFTPNTSFKLVLVNLKDLDASKELTLTGIPRELTRSSDGSHLFVLADDSIRIKDPGQAHLHIVETATGTPRGTIDGGYRLVDPVTDIDSGTSLITRIEKNGTSRLLAFRQGEKKAEIALPDNALKSTLAPKTKRLYVLCYNSVQVIDLVTLKLLGSIPTPHRKSGMWDNGSGERPPSNLAFDSAESIGVLGYSGDDEYSVLDLKALSVKGTIDLVSGAASFGKMMAVAAATGVASGAMAGAAGVPPPPVFIPRSTASQYSSSVVDPSGQLAWVLYNARVYAVDLTTYKKVHGITLGFNSNYAYIPPEVKGQSSLLFVVGTHYDSRLRMGYRMEAVNMTAKDKVLDQKWLGPCLYTQDGDRAVNYDSHSVYLLDGSTLGTVKEVGGFKELRQVLLAAPSESRGVQAK